jgi:hypothetical protein
VRAGYGGVRFRVQVLRIERAGGAASSTAWMMVRASAPRCDDRATL